MFIPDDKDLEEARIARRLMNEYATFLVICLVIFGAIYCFYQSAGTDEAARLVADIHELGQWLVARLAN